ncbi:MAG: hypothetical protein Q7J75_03225 [Rhodoferax sp.]|nr:hypothetical protein [Rhodoferax sp.]
MAHITWTENSTLCTALLDDVPVCALKTKDIGGVTASWLDGRLWAPPGHMPKATPQASRFFAEIADAKLAVEQYLHS